MKTVNRTILTVFPKKPYVEWANSFDDNGPDLEFETKHSVAILIPDKYDEFNYEKFLKKNYRIIFEEELAAWMTDPELWPKNLTYKKFHEWFDVRVSDAVIDLGQGSVIHEPF